MKVVVIGGTGFVGTQIVQELSERGHAVKTLVRDVNKVANKSVETSSVDVLKDDFSAELAGADVVVSAFNAGWTNPNLYNEFLQGSQNIEKAVQQAGVDRLVVIGGAGSLFDANGNQLVDGADFPESFKPGATAARDYLNELRNNTTLNWTFFSPAIEMHPGTSGVRKGTYRTGLENPVFDAAGNSQLSVEDLAVAIVDEVETPQFPKQRFTAAY